MRQNLLLGFDYSVLIGVQVGKGGIWTKICVNNMAFAASARMLVLFMHYLAVVKIVHQYADSLSDDTNVYFITVLWSKPKQLHLLILEKVHQSFKFVEEKDHELVVGKLTYDL